MRQPHPSKGARYSILAAAIGTLFATSTEAGFLSKPLLICDQGSFYIGGVPKVTNYNGSSTAGAPNQIQIGQMYVSFQVPPGARRWPLIMVHGSTHTGACLESTPDEREG